MIEIRQTEKYAKWFARLKDVQAKAKINVRIRRLSLGNPGDVKPVGEGVCELRIPFGPGYRVYFIEKDKEIVVLLAGGTKNRQSKDINTAKELAKDL